MRKVTLYIRERKTKRYKPARAKYYDSDTTFVLRYRERGYKWYAWENLPPGTTLVQAQVRAIEKALAITSEKSEPRVQIKKTICGPQTLEFLVDKYLDERAAQKNWRKHSR